jgi:polyisoprenyl-phosphate glycosyltransferase
MTPKLLSVIIPVLNEAGNLDALVARLTPVLDGLGAENLSTENPGVAWEIVFIDDGSTDGTLAKLKALHAREPRATGISFSRNFGKEIALAAGLQYARGDAAVMLDADLQHPPEMISQFVAKWREGYDIVYGDRIDRNTDGLFRRLYGRAFYRLFNYLSHGDIPSGAGDFRLLDRKAIDAMNRFKENSRFNKGLYAWIGFKTVGLPYQVAERSVGTTKWSLRKLTHFAIDGLTSFSTLPLRVWSVLGLTISMIAIVYAVFMFVRTIIFGNDVPGYPSILVYVMLLAGVQLISLGVLGEYLGRVYEEVKNRPLYLVADEIGTDKREPHRDMGAKKS